MTTFNIGDLVICIKPISDASRLFNLEPNVVYKIVEINLSGLILEDKSQIYNTERFIISKENLFDKLYLTLKQ